MWSLGSLRPPRASVVGDMPGGHSLVCGSTRGVWLGLDLEGQIECKLPGGAGRKGHVVGGPAYLVLGTKSVSHTNQLCDFG